MKVAPFKRILISRTDSIGDVVLTLPLCGWLKKHVPDCTVIFLGKTYTRDVADACEYIDEFLDWTRISAGSPHSQIEALKSARADVILHVFPRKDIAWVAKRAGIPIRVASGHRLYTLTKCNRPVFFSRKRSPLHESQLNFILLKALGLPHEISLGEISELYGLSRTAELSNEFTPLFRDGKKVVILHPGSRGSAVEWGLANFKKLIELLPVDRFTLVVTGTATEGKQIREEINFSAGRVVDLTGQLTLSQMIAFISRSHALVAASTGPLHLAAALGIEAIGLYAARRPVHPGRWAPIGKHAHVLVSAYAQRTDSSLSIEPEQVQDLLLLEEEVRMH